MLHKLYEQGKDLHVANYMAYPGRAVQWWNAD